MQFNIKKKKVKKKWAEDISRHFSKVDIDGQIAHEKMLNITNNQGKCKSKPQ